MRVSVTGGTGFIGRRVVRVLRERGHEVVCAVRRPEAAGRLRALGAELVKSDLGDRASLARAFAGSDGVVHLAATYELGVTPGEREQMLAANLEGTRNALETAHESGAKRIVYTSSIVVFGTTLGEARREGERPDTIAYPWPHASYYSYSKARAHFEVAVPLAAKGAPLITVLPGAVFGPGDESVFQTMWTYMARGWPLPLGGSRYGVVGIEDCAEGIVLALERGTVGESYHLVSENIGPRQLAARIAARTGLPARVVPLPDWVLRTGAPLIELLERVVRPPPAYSSESLRSMQSEVTMMLDPQKTMRELGWSPRSVDEAILESLVHVLVRHHKALPPALAKITPRLD